MQGHMIFKRKRFIFENHFKEEGWDGKGKGIGEAGRIVEEAMDVTK